MEATMTTNEARDLVVIDEKRFATWLDVRQRRLPAPPG
jgi:hypothetical protein